MNLPRNRKLSAIRCDECKITSQRRCPGLRPFVNKKHHSKAFVCFPVAFFCEEIFLKLWNIFFFHLRHFDRKDFPATNFLPFFRIKCVFLLPLISVYYILLPTIIVLPCPVLPLCHIFLQIKAIIKLIYSMSDKVERSLGIIWCCFFFSSKAGKILVKIHLANDFLMPFLLLMIAIIVIYSIDTVIITVCCTAVCYNDYITIMIILLFYYTLLYKLLLYFCTECNHQFYYRDQLEVVAGFAIISGLSNNDYHNS